jgi:biotin carboxylase
MGLRGNPVTAVRTARNKALTRRALAAAGVPQQPWRECAEPADAIAFLQELAGSPAILKPVTGAGSAGVRLVTDAAGVRDAWAALTGLAGWALLDNPGKVMIAEGVLTGRELSVEAMSRDGRHEVVAVTEKATTGAPHFVEVGHVQPAALTPAGHAAVVARVRAALSAIGHLVGPSHTEVMVDGTEVGIVETHTRFGGDQIWELTQLTTGRHFATETIAALTGRTAPTPLEYVGGAAIRFLTRELADPAPTPAPVPARILRVHRAAAPAGPLTDSSRRTGYVLAAADNPAAAASAALAYASDLEGVTP